MAASAMMGVSPIMVDGIKLHAFMLKLSELMEEAIAQDDPTARTRDPDYEPNGRFHVPFTQGSHDTKTRRWNRVSKWYNRARRTVGMHDHSSMLGTGVADALHPKGHGSQCCKLGIDARAFLDALLKDDRARARLKTAIAAVERDADHVQKCVLRKRNGNATFNMIDSYRDLFLVKHPSRGAMVSETKRLVAYMYANVMSAGPTWATEEELEDARERAACDASRDADETEQRERADVLWLRFSNEVRCECIGAAMARGWSRAESNRRWMKIAGEMWAASERNPKNAGSGAGSAGGGGRGRGSRDGRTRWTSERGGARRW